MKCMCRGGLNKHLASLFAQKHAIFLHASVRCKFIFIYFYMFQDLRRKGKQIKKNNFPFIALHSSNQHPSQASLSVWLSVVLKFSSLVKNQLWFYSYRTTRFVSLIFPALLSYFQYSFRQSQRANFIATERIRRFLSKFRIFWEITRSFWIFIYKDAETTDSQPELVRAETSQSLDLKAWGWLCCFCYFIIILNFSARNDRKY